MGDRPMGEHDRPERDRLEYDDRFPARMEPADAVMWDIEKDPVLRSTITAVAILDRSPDWERLRTRLERASRLIPRLRQRVVVPTLRIGPPRWVVDPHFELDYHLRRVRSPGGGSLADVLSVAEPIAMDAFDRARPLWQFTLVEGLEDGRAALVQKLHHSMTDGVGGIELALMLLDDERHAPELGMPAAPPVSTVSPLSLAADASREGVRAGIGQALAIPGGVLRGVICTIADPIGSTIRANDLGRSVAKMLAPIPESASSLMGDRSLGRRFHALDISLADLKAAGHASSTPRRDGTLNDAFLAGVVGGLARYHERHGAPLGELRLTMPISLRVAGDHPGGNRFAPARFAVPADIADPRVRMQRLGALAEHWRDEPGLAHTDALAAVLDRLPVSVTTSLFGGMLKHVDAVVTNVPGVDQTVYLGGAEVLRQYAFAPPTGAALNVALLSHCGRACIGVVVDTAAVDDDAGLMDDMAAAFDEVLDVVDHHAARSA